MAKEKIRPEGFIRKEEKVALMSAGPTRPERLKPFDRRVPSRLEMVFSFGVVSIVTLLGFLVLVGAFGVHPGFKLPLGVILVGYGLIRFWMLKSRFRQVENKKESVEESTKEAEENLRK
jgi:hypothetical protein